MSTPRVSRSPLVLRLVGDADLVSVDGLHPDVSAIPLDCGDHLVVDASRLAELDDRTVDLLRRVQRCVDRVGGTLELRHPSPHVQRLLSRRGLAGLRRPAPALSA